MPIRREADDMPVWAVNAQGQPICGRKINNEDRVCQSTILDRETGRCNAKGHGGGANKGGAPDQGKGRSKILRKIGLGTKLKAVQNDPGIKSHRENIELYELAIHMHLEQGIPTGDEWKQAKELYTLSVTGNAQAFKDLGALLDRAQQNEERLGLALALADRQRAHKEAEAKREAELKANLNARQANALVAALIAAVEEEDLPPDVRRRIQARAARHLNR